MEKRHHEWMHGLVQKRANGKGQLRKKGQQGTARENGQLWKKDSRAQLVKKDSYGKRIAGMDAWTSVEKGYGKGQ